jgi:DNA-binding response OmpR family regulator
MRILVAEDDRGLQEVLVLGLRDAGYHVDAVDRGDDAIDQLRWYEYDVAIIDWRMPGGEGIDVVAWARKHDRPTALLMLTARGQVEERIAGLDSGADDYLVKPFAFDELLARLRALGRRFNVPGGGAELRAGELVLDQRAHQAWRGQRILNLTATEWRLLECLMRRPGQVFTRDQILDYAWSYERDVLPSMVEVYISYLRRKLNAAGRPDPIQTVRGVGYRLDPDNA